MAKARPQPLLVKMDPRVHMSQSELEALHTAQTTMASSLDELAKADLQAHSVMEQVAAVQDPALAKQLATFQCRAEDNPGRHGTKCDASACQASTK